MFKILLLLLVSIPSLVFSQPALVDDSWTHGSGKVTLTDSGDNVGIGSATPGTKLDVTGTIRASTDVKVGSQSVCLANGTNCPAGGSVTSVTGSSPISSSGGTTPDISIANAVADGSTKGAASFTASDFNSLSGNISLDYANGQEATSGQDGFLSSTDWTTFNSKQASGNYITALTGDVTASGPGSSAATLATVNSNVGSFTNASITVNAKGLITAASTGSVPSGANPTATVGTSAINGSASTFMRSDGAPALNVGISPTWTGNHVFSPSSGDTIFSSGNVGIGTTTPQAKFVVFSGNVGIGTITTIEPVNGITQGLSIKGSRSSGDPFGFYVENVATDGKSYGLINHQNSSGISHFQVRGNGAALSLYGYGSGVAGTSLSNSRASSSALIADNGKLLIGTGTSTDVILGANNTEYMRINSTGNIGIGSATPGSLLDIYGNSRILNSGNLYVSGNIGIGTTTPQASLVVKDGNVGIGTITAGSKLTVMSGNIGVGTTVAQSAITALGSSKYDGGRLQADYMNGGVTSGTSLLLHFDAADASTSFLDSSSNAVTLTAQGNAQIDTAQSVFGGASGLFDGTGDYLTFPDSSNFQVTTGDFTIEGRFRTTTTAIGTQGIFGDLDGGGSNWSIMIDFDHAVAPDAIRVSASFTDASSTYVVCPGTLSANTWYHFMIYRSGSNLGCAIDGTFGTPGNIGSKQFKSNQNGSSWSVGQLGSYGLPMNGWLDEFMFTKGTARKTSAFTPETYAFYQYGSPSLVFSSAGTNIFSIGIDGSDSNKLKIGTTSVDTNTRITVNSSGNVGIGSTNPGQILDVNGTTRSTAFSGPLTGNVTGNASTATALASNPTDCSSNQFANAIAASGNLTCADPFTLTTTGSSGAATFSAGTLNIPQYTGGTGTNYWALEAGNVGINTTTVNVGIGTVTTNAKLTIGSTGQTNIDSNGRIGIGTTFTTTSALTIMNGNVGIGTWIPSAMLEVKGGDIKPSGRVIKRVTTASDATSITPNSDTTDIVYQSNTQAAGTLTINADSGTPLNGQSLLFKIKCTNAQTFSWNAVYDGGTVALPTATTGSSTIDYYSFIYDTVNSKWHYTGTAGGM